MKIAIVAPVEESIPPKKYGGIEWIVYYVASGMGKKGHIVDLYASGDSKKDEFYNLIPTTPLSLREEPDFANNVKKRDVAKLQSIALTIESIQKQKYDIVHNNTGWRLMTFSNLVGKNFVTTHHGPLDMDYEQLVFEEFKNLPSISISNNQRLDLPELNFIATIYNGTDITLFPYFEHADPAKHDAMLFFARMSHEKGAIEAAKTAILCKKKLLVTAKVDFVDQAYFSEFKKLIDNNYVTFIAESNPQDRIYYYQHARCLLAPIQWEEPFGLMFTESMSCGTPVIAFARGSAPEIIKDGETGFLVNSSDTDIRGDWIIKETGVAGLCKAVEKMFSLGDNDYLAMRRKSRSHVEKHFSTDRMTQGYEEVFKKIVNKTA